MRCPSPRICRNAGLLTLATLVVYGWLGPLLSSAAATNPYDGVPAAVPKDPGLNLREHLSEAVVSYGEHRCGSWTGSRWDCGLSAWEWIGRYIGRVTTPAGPEWRACIFAHPRDARDGRTVPLTISFPSLRLGSDLHGEAAILDVPRSGEPVVLTVDVGGRRKTRLRLTDKDGRREWQRWQVVTPAGEVGEREDVTFEVSATNPEWRHVCFTAFVGTRAQP